MNVDLFPGFQRDMKLRPEKIRGGFIDPAFARQQDSRLEACSDVEINAYFASPAYASAIADGKRVIWPNPIFDPNCYVELNPAVLGHNPVVHFTRIGHSEGRPWNPLFDASYVRSKLNIRSGSVLDVISIFLESTRKRPTSGHPLIDPVHIALQTGCDPRTAYLDVVAGTVPADVDPHRLFATRYYAACTGLEFALMREMLIDYLTNWSQRPAPIHLFDRAFVSRHLPSLPATSDAYLAYLSSCETQTIPPGGGFDVEYYRVQCAKRKLPPVANPLLHFVEHGLKNGVSPTRLFNADYYAQAAGVERNSLRHYFEGGFRQFGPNAVVDLHFVAEKHPDFKLGRSEFIEWYSAKPLNDSVLPHPRFDAVAYAKHSPDIKNTGPNVITHFMSHGLREGRQPELWFSSAYVRNDAGYSLSRQSAVHEYFARSLNRRRKLVFVSHDASMTGAPAIILRLLKDFSTSGQFECYTLLDRGGPRIREFQRYSHTYVLHNTARHVGWDSAETHQEIESVIGSLGGEAPALAFVNSAESRHMGRSLAALGIKVISLVHEVASYYQPESFNEILSWSDRVIYPSRYVDREARKFAPDEHGKTVVLGQGLLHDHFGLIERKLAREDICRRHNISPNSRIVLGCGSRNLRKGIDLFSAVIREFVAADRPEDRDVHFIWVGGGPDHPDTPSYYARIEAIICGFEDRVTYASECPDVEPYFVAADAFLLTSRADPFPCVVHEAMAAGLAVIGFSDAGGAEELYQEMGRSVPFGNSAAMAAELHSLLASDATSEHARAQRRDYIVRNHQSQSYFQFFLKEVLRAHGEELDDTWAREVPSSPGQVVFIANGKFSDENELLYMMAHELFEAGLPVRFLRVSETEDAVDNDSIFPVVAPGYEYIDWFGEPGRSYRDLISGLAQNGGAVVVTGPPVLRRLTEASYHPRAALILCSLRQPNLQQSEAYLEAGVQLFVTPDDRPDRLSKLGYACPSQKIRLKRSPRPSSDADGRQRLFVSAFGEAGSAFDGLLLLAPLISILRQQFPGSEVQVICSRSMKDELEQRIAGRYALSGISIAGVANELEFGRLFAEGDIFCGFDQGEMLPPGLITAASKNMRILMLSQRSSHMKYFADHVPYGLIMGTLQQERIAAWLRTPMPVIQPDDGLIESLLTQIKTLSGKAITGAIARHEPEFGAIQ